MMDIPEIMQTEAEILKGKKCCFPGCEDDAECFDEMDNPMCYECEESQQ